MSPQRLLMRFSCALLMLVAGSMGQAADRPNSALAQAVATGPARVLVSLTLPAAKAGDARAKQAIAEQREAVLADLPADSFQLQRSFATLPAFAARIDQRALAMLVADPRVSAIELDSGGSGQMLQAAPLAHVVDLQTLGLVGAGATIAVVDSGIIASHPDFTGRVVAQQCFCSAASGNGGCCPNGSATQTGAGAALDENGHGTNVSGILAGGGAVAAPGVAPAAAIVAVRVLDRNNSFCCLSDVLAAFDWIRSEHPEVQTINASLGTSSLFAGDCDNASPNATLAASALEALWHDGVLLTASAGNQRAADAMSLPACLSRALAVGATWDANAESAGAFNCTDAPVVAGQAACFGNSSAGADIYAPGAFITSSGRTGGLSTYAGTSQASPLVGGCAAIIRAAVPGARVADVRAALLGSTDRVVDAKNARSFPRLDCTAALSQLRAINARNRSGFYSASANPGYALNLTHQDDTIALAWYTYAETGRPVWFTASATAQTDGSYRGDYYQSRGVPLTQINGAPALLGAESRGRLSLRFSDNDLLELEFVPASTSLAQQRVLAPLAFANPPPRCRFSSESRSSATNMTDLWWNPAENGWGLSLAEQAGSIFLAWYSYAADNQPQWITGLLARQPDGSYLGALSRANSGTAYTLPPDGALTSFPLPTVGDASLRFVDGEHGSFRYSVDGQTRTVAIERFVFGALLQRCE